MVIAEVIGIEAFQERVKLYGTDLDNDALAKARLGAYSESDLADVPAPLVEKYFERRDQGFVFRKDLRRCVIFGRNDLMQDAPISRVDLLACRNTLMYFDGPTQARILARFHFALNDGGYLFLGRAETMLTHGDLFVPVDLRRRIFTKVPSRRRAPAARPPRERAAGRSATRRICRCACAASTPARCRSSSSTRWAGSFSPTRVRVCCSGSPAPTWVGRSRTSRSRTGRTSCAR